MDKMHIFVKINEPKGLQSLVVLLRSQLEEIKLTLANVNSLSEEEKGKIDEWKARFSSSNEKIESISGKMLDPEA
jgi:hypothetical protein